MFINNMKGSIYLSLFFAISVIFSGCNDKPQKTESTTVPSVSQQKVQILDLDKNKYELPLDLFIETKINDEELVGLKNKDKNIYAYNFKTKKQRVLLENKSDKFIHKVKANSEWIVYIQDEAEILNTNDKPYKWEILAKNIKTGEILTVDKTSFTTKNYEVPVFVDFSPTELELDGDIVVYTKTMPDGKKVSSEINIFDLKRKEQTTISKSVNVIDDYIVNFHINDGKIVWNKYKQLNDAYTKRMTQYMYSDIYIYDIISKKTEQLSENKFLDRPHLYRNNLVAINVPENKPGQATCASDVVLMDINSKNIKTIVNDKSECYTEPVNEVYRDIPNINSKYISWYDNGGGSNMCLFDYVNNNFVKIYNKEVSDSQINVKSMVGNLVIVYDSRSEENQSKSICIDLK